MNHVTDDGKSADGLRPRRATRLDVAHEAGTSVTVVTYVLQNGPRSVAPATRERVLRAIEKVNYRPNRVAQALVRGRTGTFGLVVPNITNPFVAEITHAIESVAFSSKRVLLVGDSADERQREQELIQSLLSQQVDGVIYMGVTEKLWLDAFRESNTPVVVFTHAESDGACPSVRIDERGAVASLVEHLLAHGYRDVAMLTGPDHMMNSYLRLEGWQQAMDAAHLPAPRESIGRTPYSRFAAYRWATDLVKSGRLPRALVTGSERQAVGVLAAFADAGVRVPDDVAIAALNGSPDSAFTVPSLTSIRQPSLEMAATAFSILDKPQEYPPKGVLFDFDLIQGRSCGCEESPHRDRWATSIWRTPGEPANDAGNPRPA